MTTVIIDGVPYVPATNIACRVSIHGMYEMHLFHRITGKTVDEVIKNWKNHNAKKQPALVGEREVDDLGPSMLCPAVVLDANDKELRRVGEMVFPEHGTRQAKTQDIEKYRTALLADPDITRLLAIG